METKKGFTKMTIAEFETWLKSKRVARTITRVQQHHTYIPSYIHFKGNNHFDMQQSMKDSHLSRKFTDIAQHFSIFPDGTILTGRNLEKLPAGITNQNGGAICIENVGYFDKGKDNMTQEQANVIVKVTALLCQKFNLPVNTNSIIYHHWFRLSDGFRNNGGSTTTNKSCPGTNFFGGNKVPHCEANFLPLVKQLIKVDEIKSNISTILEYVVVTSTKLNIRTLPSSSSSISKDRDAASFGSLLRVYEKKDGFLKISNSKSHWVAEKFTKKVTRAKVISTSLNMRSGSNTNYPIVGKLAKDQEILIEKKKTDGAKLLLKCFG